MASFSWMEIVLIALAMSLLFARVVSKLHVAINPAVQAMINPAAVQAMINPAAVQAMINPAAVQAMINPAAVQAMINPAAVQAVINPTVSAGQIV